jgi:hypothetical protein
MYWRDGWNGIEWGAVTRTIRVNMPEESGQARPPGSADSLNDQTMGRGIKAARLMQPRAG